LAVILTTTLGLLDAYGYRLAEVIAYNRFIMYFILPAALVWLWRDRPADYGLQRGAWREGLAWTLAACVGMGLILWFVARQPAMVGYYQARLGQGAARAIGLAGLELFAWEFVWRGFLLFTLARVIGPGPAIFLQSVPFTFLHVGKPPIETFTTLFGGVGFGFIAWRTRSCLYPWLIHWFVMSFTMLVAADRL
jgi:membrane protease YdiL (CAAX protease family)